MEESTVGRPRTAGFRTFSATAAAVALAAVAAAISLHRVPSRRRSLPPSKPLRRAAAQATSQYQERILLAIR